MLLDGALVISTAILFKNQAGYVSLFYIGIPNKISYSIGLSLGILSLSL